MDRFLVHEVPTGQRSMHALVIGIGNYPHLLGGGDTTTDSHDGMKQLTSPPVSARAMADWLIEEFNHPDYPGGTVSLLLSEKPKKKYENPSTGARHDVEPATYANVKDAIYDWKDRGDQHVDDMLVFFFCGHGISEGESMVLPMADFGSNPHNAYEHALDFPSVYDGMAQTKARRQCYFIDACRSSSDTLSGNSGQSPLQVKPRTAPGVRNGPVYYSTLKGDEAHGREGECSLYTDALLRSLSDLAATDDEGDDDWRVCNFELTKSLDHLMKREHEAGSEVVQVPVSAEVHDRFYIHHLKAPPKANLYIFSEPIGRLADAHLLCARNRTELAKRAPKPGIEWAVTVPVGDVRIEAKLTDDTKLDPPKKAYARPIYKRVRLDLP